MKKFNWKEASYPCLGITEGKLIVCFSSYGAGHNLGEGSCYSNSWIMENFTPYTKPKERVKLWYWEFKLSNGTWKHSYFRYSDAYAKEHFEEYRKLEALGYIEED